ncbi:hypothetical protein BS78_04G112700 [Paspalum vaginatum]|nr:hypothetical protein BS78_04G112700 [Paspalum vaginatum]
MPTQWPGVARRVVLARHVAAPSRRRSARGAIAKPLARTCAEPLLPATCPSAAAPLTPPCSEPSPRRARSRRRAARPDMRAAAFAHRAPIRRCAARPATLGAVAVPLAPPRTEPSPRRSIHPVRSHRCPPHAEWRQAREAVGEGKGGEGAEISRGKGREVSGDGGGG